ncbi:MAG: tetratricopeptide repeat protein [Candidatus Krumholzibacteriota bacterium]|nr:tetratricopeptide repeat protein [Candidatus Krumholzibacteriota bacterium]
MRNDCMTTEEMAALLDGRLTAHERRRIDAHLENCPSCLAELIAARAEYREFLSPPAGRPRRRGSVALAAAAAAVAILAVAVLLRSPAADGDLRAGAKLVRGIVAESRLGELRLPGDRRLPGLLPAHRGPAVEPEAGREAERRLAAAAGRHPKNASIRLLLGYLYLARGDLGMAEVSCREADRLEPDDPAILTALAVVRYRLGRNDEALGLLRRASSFSGAPPETFYNLAVVAARTGDAALSAWSRDAYLARDAGSPWVMQLRALVP